MSDERPDYDGPGPEKMMRELMQTLKGIQPSPVVSFQVSRAELVAHFEERAGHWRHEAAELNQGRELEEKEVRHLSLNAFSGDEAAIVGRELEEKEVRHLCLNAFSGDEAAIVGRELEEKEVRHLSLNAFSGDEAAIVLGKIRKSLARDAEDRSRTFAFFAKHVIDQPVFMLDLYMASALELVPTHLSVMPSPMY